MFARALLLLFVALQGRPSSPPTVFVVDALSRVRPKDAPGTLKEARIKAARNEAEAFQVVVRAGEGGIKEVTAEASDLRGEGDRVIGRRHVSIFREHYLEVKTPTMKSKEPPGLIPDALIPLVLPKAPAKPPRFVGSPFALPADFNQPLWVEIAVPKDAAAGEYAGQITVSAAGQRPVVVPVTLVVWDFTLPDTPTLRTNFGGLGKRLLTGHAGFKPDTAPYRALERRYAEAMAAHRLCPPIPPYLRPKVGPGGAIDPKETHAGLKEWIETFHVTGIRVDYPEDKDPAAGDPAKYFRTLAAYFKESGWEKLPYVTVGDEPNDQKAYEEVRKRAKLIHEAAPGLKVLCTEQPAPQDPAWGTLVGSVDLWVPLWPHFDEKSVAERQKAGEEVWSTTTLCQGRDGEETPFWQLDFPLLNYRIPAWASRRYGLSGLLYWTVVYWIEGDTWTMPVTHKQQSTGKPFNGEGVLFYPGTDAGIDGPVASMRLKALRDGLEDYEYLVLAGDAGVAKAGEIARSWTRWETDRAKVLAARDELAKIILEKKK